MHLSDFNYELPQELIAQHPLSERSASRMLVLHKKTNSLEHRTFKDLFSYLTPGDLLIFNNTRVIPARLFAKKSTGGKVEILIERVLDQKQAWAQLRSSKKNKIGTLLELTNKIHLKIIDCQENLYLLQTLTDESISEVLDRMGNVPLPPYMNRSSESIDKERYQTVYAKEEGAVAAPTAGLHFSEEVIRQLKEVGVNMGFVTLHVGAGTFKPVRVENIIEHTMHEERVEVSSEVCELIRATKQAGKRVIAVGTTVVRSLETAASSGEIQPYCGETKIFIYPGYRFKCVDALFTNFHAPCSTLLMLVSAFASQQLIMHAYNEAIKLSYRFLSYGDAMLIVD